MCLPLRGPTAAPVLPPQSVLMREALERRPWWGPAGGGERWNLWWGGNGQSFDFSTFAGGVDGEVLTEEVAEGLGICRHHNATMPMLLAAHALCLRMEDGSGVSKTRPSLQRCICAMHQSNRYRMPPWPSPLLLNGPFP